MLIRCRGVQLLNIFCPFLLARIEITVCDASKLELLLNNIERCTSLKYIIKIGDIVTDEEQKKAREHGVEILTFSQVEVTEDCVLSDHGFFTTRWKTSNHVVLLKRFYWLAACFG